MHEDEPATGLMPGGQSEVFIVRFWYERRELSGAEPCWRGVVQHVASGQRHFLREPRLVVPFIATFIAAADEGG